MSAAESTLAAELAQLAAQAGLLADWVDAHGQARSVAPQTLRALLASLGLGAENRGDIRDSLHALNCEQASQDGHFRAVLTGESFVLATDRSGPYVLEGEDGARHEGRLHAHAGEHPRLVAPEAPGYYRLHLACGLDMTLAVAPRCPRPFGPLAGKTDSWGLAAQVYSLRRDDPDPARRTLGHGDFGAVRALASHAAAAGADVLALSPVHAMFSANPAYCSPYSPSNRLLLNVLYADPAAVLGEDFVRAALAGLPVDRWIALDRRALIDWRRSGRARLALLRALHTRFLAHPPPGLPQRLAQFRRQAGPALESHALFEALHAVMSAGRDAPMPWTDWDPALRTPGSPALREFAGRHARELEFHCFAQWLAHDSLARAQSEARQGGMRVGLLADLAIGCSPLGSQAWGQPDEHVRRASLGAPPDIHNPAGQDWGLLAVSPRTLRERGYAPYIDLLRANLALAGGVRIDHVLGLSRLWLVPDGANPGDGAYLRYPAETLFRLTALEAWRRQALVIGENLGTVPEGFDQTMREHGMAGMSVLWFMRTPDGKDGRPAPFLPPRDWPADSAAMPNTHDLPTLCGWWTGQDIAWKRRAGVAAEIAALYAQRRQDRLALWQALRPAGQEAAPAAPPLARMLEYVASSAGALAIVAMEDMEGMRYQPNLPGTTTGHLNWRRRLPRAAGAGFGRPAFQERLDALRRGRGRT